MVRNLSVHVCFANGSESNNGKKIYLIHDVPTAIYKLATHKSKRRKNSKMELKTNPRPFLFNFDVKGEA